MMALKNTIRLKTERKYQKEEYKNVLLVKRRKQYAMKSEDLLHCPECNACLSRHQLALHLRSKHQTKAGRNVQSRVAASEPVNENVSDRFKEKVLDRLQVGEVRFDIRNDPLIMKRGEKLFNKEDTNVHPKYLENVRNKTRDLARLVIEARKSKNKKTRRLAETLLLRFASSGHQESCYVQ